MNVDKKNINFGEKKNHQNARITEFQGKSKCDCIENNFLNLFFFR